MSDGEYQGDITLDASLRAGRWKAGALQVRYLPVRCASPPSGQGPRGGRRAHIGRDEWVGKQTTAPTSLRQSEHPLFVTPLARPRQQRALRGALSVRAEFSQRWAIRLPRPRGEDDGWHVAPAGTPTASYPTRTRHLHVRATNNGSSSPAADHCTGRHVQRDPPPPTTAM